MVWRGRAGRDADCARPAEPFRTKIRLRLDVVHVRTDAAARVYELARVVAVRAADDDDDVTLAGQLESGALALLRRLTDRVDEADVGAGKSTPDERDEVSHPVDRLRRLGRNAYPRMFGELQHIVLVLHNVEVVEVVGQAAHLHVRPMADDDRVIDRKSVV